jgi:hypothetical protein
MQKKMRKEKPVSSVCNVWVLLKNLQRHCNGDDLTQKINKNQKHESKLSYIGAIQKQ